MTDSKTSIAVWDVPMPVVAGEAFTIKVGVKSASRLALAGGRVEVCNATGVAVASGALAATPLAGTEALYWTALDVPAPSGHATAEYIVRFVAGQGHEASTSRFSVVAAAKPEHTLTVHIMEQDTKEALGGVELRLGPFHARTDKAGRAELRIAAGDYRLELWRTAHIAPPRTIEIKGDTSLALTMVNVPEEHPDARWVR